MKLPFLSKFNGNGGKSSEERRDLKKRNAKNREIVRQVPEAFTKSRDELRQVCNRIVFPDSETEEENKPFLRVVGE